MVDAMSLLPPASDRNPYGLLPFKQALAAQFGVEEGFQAYKSALGLRDSLTLRKKALRPLRDFAAEKATNFVEIFPAGEPFSIQPLRVVGEGNHRVLRGSSRSFFSACLRDAQIPGGSNFIFADGAALFDYQGEEIRRLCDQIELDPAIFSVDEKSVWAIEDPDRAVVAVEEAFGSLLGVLSSAFGHWLWEYLPKYLTAAFSGAVPKVPVLIPIEMPRTHRQALEMVLPPGVDIIEISAFGDLRVQKLWCAPSLMYMALLPAPGHVDSAADHQAFPPHNFTYAIEAFARGAERSCLETTGIDRVYLARRDVHQRLLVNWPEIEAIVKAHGFAVVHTEDLDFAEQVRYVRNARFIIGPEGSQLLLSLFARPGAKLCNLCHPFMAGPAVRNGVAVEMGVEVTVVNGPVVNPHDEPGYPNFGIQHFADYQINAAKFTNFIERWLKE